MQDVPGVTRDRVSYDALWSGRRFVVQDTGGWEPDAKGLQQLVAEQASVAMRTADAIVFVVDATVGATTADEAAARLLQRSGKPVFLAANKVDNERGEADAAELWSLGLGEPYPISAMHGRGVADLLDKVDRFAARGVRDGVGRGRSASSCVGGQAECGQELAAESTGRRRAVGGARRGGHDRRPGRLADRNGRQDLAFRRYGGTAPQGRRRPAGTSSMRRCARTARSMPPRWPSC